MPTIRIDMFEGRTPEQKRALAAAITEACVKTIGSSADSVDILMFDIAKQNWATGGVLWSDQAAAKPGTSTS
jgi:4-oxalocrotonate tautomerase